MIKILLNIMGLILANKLLYVKLTGWALQWPGDLLEITLKPLWLL